MRMEKLDVPQTMVGEGPLWDVAEQAFYFIDIVKKQVHRFDPATGQTRSWEVPRPIGSMALRVGGGAIISLPDGVHTLDFDTGEVAPLALPEDQNPRIQFNDGKVDRRGRFIVGSTDSNIGDCQPIGSVYSLGADHSLTVIDTGIHISNGPCFAPDNKTFYFADSVPFTLYAYDYDIETGAATNRRPFAETREHGGFPDGCTVDAEGNVWMALCEGGKILCYRPDGKLERVIETPMQLPASVMFGGADLDQLYLTSIDPALLGRPSDEHGGSTGVITDLGVRGIAEPRYAG